MTTAPEATVCSKTRMAAHEEVQVDANQLYRN